MVHPVVAQTPHIVYCPMGEEQRALQEQLRTRAAALRAGTVPPWEDHMRAITTNVRKLALDARLISAAAPDSPGSKINTLVANVTAIWQRTTPARGTQLIFSDLGVNPTAWGYAVYEDIIAKLGHNGIPRDHIAAVGEAATDAKKQVLYEKVRAGAIRVLLGSTRKMGTGTPVQQRLVALHHLDPPRTPAAVAQRDGHLLCQGHGNGDVVIYRYVTQESFDIYMWQTLETKARMIAQIMRGDSTVLQAEDLGQERSAAKGQARASGHSAVHLLAEAEPQRRRLLMHGFQAHPDLAVALLEAFRRALLESRDTLTAMEQEPSGDSAPEDIAAKRWQVAQDEALLRRIEALSGPEPYAPL